MKKGSHHTPESLAKMSATQSKRIIAPETGAKISARLRGRPVGPEWRKKLSVALTGHKTSDVARMKMSIAQKHRYATTDLKEILCRKGTKLTQEHRDKISESERGEKNASWKGGVSFEPYCPKFNDDLRERIRAFFGYHCVCCGKPQTKNITKSGKKFKLQCHHVEYNKQACCDGMPIHFAALCIRCHVRTNNDRPRWMNMFHRIIDEIYDGRSYFTKEEWKNICK